MEATVPFQQNASGAMTYPDRGTLNRLLFKTPLIWWRMGMGGILGHYMLVLNTWGRNSHLPRHTMLSYTPTKDCIYIGAGWGLRCDWYRNLLANAHVTVQLSDEQVTGKQGEVMIPAIARPVTDEEEFSRATRRLFEDRGDSHMKPWLASLGINYDHEDLVAKRERVNQVALDLKPLEAGGKLDLKVYPEPMETDLKWVWAVMAGAFGLGWFAGRLRR